MTKFSSRYGYDPKDSKTPITEDAPEWVRTAYKNNILNKLTYIDRDSRYKHEEGSPLGIKELIEVFSRLCREDLPNNTYDSYMCDSVLSDMISGCEWYHFYDLVEQVGKRLKEFEASECDEGWLSVFGSKRYIRNVNSLFKEENISWRLDSDSNLTREIPKALQKALDKTSSELTASKYEPVSFHYNKAVSFIYHNPVDPQNAIKETVTALESLGKILYPGNATLGDVIKALRKTKSVPSLLIPVIDKFYNFANAEAGVRHGSSVKPSLLLQDAEFCLHVGVALIFYLLSCNDQKL